MAGLTGPEASASNHLLLCLQVQSQLLASLQVARLQLKVLTCLSEAGQRNE